MRAGYDKAEHLHHRLLYIVATKERTVQPALQRFVAKRMGAATTEVESSHVPMLSNPKLVLDVIRKAAHAVQKSAAPQSV
jgi:pimeloyl-ACP methyl ester carboxylesterase